MGDEAMTSPTSKPGVPGLLLLRIARAIFDDSLLAAVVHPTIADMQREVLEAGSSRGKRLLARWRGYRAFWTLAFVVPFSLVRPAVDRHRAVIAFPDVAARLAMILIALTILAFLPWTGPALTGWMMAVAIGGACFAIAIHVWSERHPSLVPTVEEPRWRVPEINFSSTRVSGNVGGLIFAVGSLFIIVLGLPGLLWFLFAGIAGGSCFAWALVSWHTSHPRRGLPENLIVLR
jgi:hypothetical protein